MIKEMQNIRVAFDIKSHGMKPPPGYEYVDLMMVFDIKMDYTRKARLCAHGDQTEPPKEITYSSVVSRESIRIAFMYVAMLDLDIRMADVGNAYLYAPMNERLYTICGPEFGEDEGKVTVIVHALYGLKGSGAAYRSFFAQTLRDMGFESCLADPDVWLGAATKANGTEYYEYILVYVDDLLVISEKPVDILETLKSDYSYKLKGEEEPKRYLGATIDKYDLDGKICWSISAESYLEKAIPTVEEEFGNLFKAFDKKKVTIPVPEKYHPELDTTDFLDEYSHGLYHSYIGILRWAVELGRIDIAHAVSVMSRFSAMP